MFLPTCSLKGVTYLLTLDYPVENERTLSFKQDAPEAIISAQLLVKISYVAHLVAQSERHFCCHSNIIFIAINCATEFYWHKEKTS